MVFEKFVFSEMTMHSFCGVKMQLYSTLVSQGKMLWY